MKHLLHTALFTGCLCASLFCHAQFSETLLDENFDNDQLDTTLLSVGYPDKISIVNDRTGKGNHLEPIPLFTFQYPYIQNYLIYQNENASQYDSLEATFVLDPDISYQLGPDNLLYFGNGFYKLFAAYVFTLYYKDEIRDTVFTKAITGSYYLEVGPGNAKIVQYNPSTKTLTMKWGNQSALTLLNYTNKVEYNDITCTNYPMEDFNQLKDCFCNTTTNPIECKQELWQPFIPPLRLAIDNLVVKGVQNIITGIDDHSEMPPKKEKHIVKSVDLMGREIQDMTNYKGPAILLFSDGSREKRLF